MDVFSTEYLMGVVQSLLIGPPPQFLVDTYFPGEISTDAEEIRFDVIKGTRRIAPFCSPLVEGKIVESAGFYSQTFKPAYVKDKRVFDANRGVRRAPGEAIAGTLSIQERIARVIAADTLEQITMLRRRFEVMAGEILATGAVTIAGDKYPTTVVNFQRDSSLTITLTGGSRWNQAGTDPLADLETWSNLVFGLSGATPMDVVMDLSAWKIFRANAAVLAYVNRFNANGTTLRLDAVTGEGVQDRGSIAGFNIYVYQSPYYDDVSATTKQILPTNTVLLAAREIDGYKAFGAIRDHEKLQATPYFQKSWLEQDPSVRYLMLQSAPLLVPLRANAMAAATVA